MIPEKNKTYDNPAEEDVKSKSFNLFDPINFLNRLLRNWYWFVILGMLGYAISFFYSKYYAQRVYASNLTLSISNNTASYFTPNQSINFIWGQNGNQDGIYIKKILMSRSLNEYLVNKLDLYTTYTTKGVIKQTYLDQDDSPVILRIDKTHLQQTNYPITIIPKGHDKYEIVLPEEGHAITLYNYTTEAVERVGSYKRPANKIIGIDEWYTSPNLRFKLEKNPNPPLINYENINVTLKSVSESVGNIVSTLSVSFDPELPSIMIIGKSGYNLNGTVRFLNIAIEELIKKRLEDTNTVDKNTLDYLAENILKVRKKLDSSAANLNQIKVDNKLYDMTNLDSKTFAELKNLESKRAELLAKMKNLDQVRNVVNSNNIEKIINISSAGIEDGVFSASVSELKALYAKRREMATIYTPNSEPMREINRLINEARLNSTNGLRQYYSTFDQELSNLNSQVQKIDSELYSLPEKQRLFLDSERGYNIIEATYNTLLSEQAKAQMRIVSNKSNLTIIDKAKNLGQGPIAPDIKMTQNGIIGGLLLIPLLLIAVSEVLDNRVRNIKEIVSVIKIPLLGVIGKNTEDSSLSVLDRPKSSIAESFRGIRSNLKFLLDDTKESKIILITSSISGEGKTYNSMNLATVLAISGKKTVLVGMDLRKPKIFGDFKFTNKNGVSNYLTGEVTLEQIVNSTQIPSLDVIT